MSETDPVVTTRHGRHSKLGRKPLRGDGEVGLEQKVELALPRILEEEQKHDDMPVFPYGFQLGEPDPTGATPPSVSAPITYPLDGVHLKADSVTSDHIASQTVTVGKFIMSENYDPGVDGWAIDGNGNAEFNDVTVRGVVEGSLIIGSDIATALTGPRTVIDSTPDAVRTSPKLRFYNDHDDEVWAGQVWGWHSGTNDADGNAHSRLLLYSGSLTTAADGAEIWLISKKANGTGVEEINLEADLVHVKKDLRVNTNDASAPGGVYIQGTTGGNCLKGDWGGSGGGIQDRSGGNVLSFDWDGTNIKFYIDATHVKTL